MVEYKAILAIMINHLNRVVNFNYQLYGISVLKLLSVLDISLIEATGNDYDSSLIKINFTTHTLQIIIF